MVIMTLYSVPFPGQTIKGERKFLNTTRTQMHKASLTALTAGLEKRLNERGIPIDIKVIDMQILDPQIEKYGEINYGGLPLEKYRIGSPFSKVDDMIEGSDIIGVSANFTHSRMIVSDFIRYSKLKNKGCLVIVGGG